MSGGRDSVELGSVEWAVVTSHLVPSGLFVRLEEEVEIGRASCRERV